MFLSIGHPPTPAGGMWDILKFTLPLFAPALIVVIAWANDRARKAATLRSAMLAQLVCLGRLIEEELAFLTEDAEATWCQRRPCRRGPQLENVRNQH